MRLCRVDVGGTTGLYSVDLVGGTATSLGAIDGGTTVLRGLTAPWVRPRQCLHD
jgi:hypothetical protein